jgi:hypothetical protein
LYAPAYTSESSRPELSTGFEHRLGRVVHRLSTALFIKHQSLIN